MEELSSEQLEELQRDLLSLSEEIERLLTLTKDGVRPVDLEEPIGRLTRMDALQQQSLARANRQVLELRRKQVLGALKVYDSGSYGMCRSCEGHIGFRRLKVRPETPFCVRCQERMESGH